MGRLLLDAYNIARAQGTGVATYGRESRTRGGAGWGMRSARAVRHRRKALSKKHVRSPVSTRSALARG